MTSPSQSPDRSHRITVCTTCRLLKTGEAPVNDAVAALDNLTSIDGKIAP